MPLKLAPGQSAPYSIVDVPGIPNLGSKIIKVTSSDPSVVVTPDEGPVVTKTAFETSGGKNIPSGTPTAASGRVAVVPVPPPPPPQPVKVQPQPTTPQNPPENPNAPGLSDVDRKAILERNAAKEKAAADQKEKIAADQEEKARQAEAKRVTAIEEKPPVVITVSISNADNSPVKDEFGVVVTEIKDTVTIVESPVEEPGVLFGKVTLASEISRAFKHD